MRTILLMPAQPVSAIHAGHPPKRPESVAPVTGRCAWAIRASVVAAFCLGSAAIGDAGVLPFPAETAVLDNGLKIIVISMPGRGLVSYYSVVRTGSRDEYEPGKSGFAHFFEHMMFQGTKKHPRAAYQAAVSRTGAQSNAFTTDDLTAYHFTMAKEDLERVMEIESDRFQNLAYGELAFQTEAGAVYGEYRKSFASPLARLHEKMQDLAYDVHTYKHTTMGFEADIKKMPEGFEYSRSFFDRYYRPENVILLVVGDADMAGVQRLAQKYYGGWKPGYVAPKIQQEPPQTAERSAELAYEGASLPILNLAYKGDRFDPASRDFAAATLIDDLAFGPTGELYKRLVLREQKVDVLAASIPKNRDVPLFEIIARVIKPSDVSTVQQAIEQTLEDLKTRPVEGQRLADAKRRAKYAFLMELDSPDKVARALARVVAVTGGLEAVDRHHEELGRVEPADICRAAKKYFDVNRRTRVLLKGTKS